MCACSNSSKLRDCTGRLYRCAELFQGDLANSWIVYEPTAAHPACPGTLLWGSSLALGGCCSTTYSLRSWCCDKHDVLSAGNINPAA
ncbi:hypothetical protein BJX62DRAFT_217959 [Aspergillus germanicus]